MTYRIRTAAAADEKRINELFREMLRTINHTDEEDGYESGYLDKFWNGGEDRIFVAETDSIVAFISVEIHREQQTFAYLDDFSVSEAYRSRGIGSALLKEAESYAKELGMPVVTLHVEKNNEAGQRFYSRAGYSIYRDDGHRYLLLKKISGEKIRTIITQDAEVDDQNSLRHFLLYANEVELQGIVQTSSKFHWIGVPGAVKPEGKNTGDFAGIEQSGPFDQPYRWTGTDWMMQEIDDYEKDYPNLVKHAGGYPAPDYLRSIVKIGNIGYEGEMETPTEGSELIRKAMLDDDPRPLYLQVWGGTNTIARALMDIQNAYEGSPEWTALHEKITKKVILTACGEQDGTYRSYIAENWPGIMFVKTLQMHCYAYPWFIMPEGESKDTLKAAFMTEEILNGKSRLMEGYCTWLDGKEYEGEGPEGQFGANPNIADEWFGAKMGLPKPEPFDFLSEGDSPTFFLLFDWGFRTLEDFAWGGISGRYHRVTDQVNSKGETLNLWDVSRDTYVGRDGQEHLVESMWPYVADIQRDLAARSAWCSEETYEEGEHAPHLAIQEGLDIIAAPGEKILLHAIAEPADQETDVHVTFHIYKVASAGWAAETALMAEDHCAKIVIPEEAEAGSELHIIVKAQADGHHRLVHYQQAVVRIREAMD